MIKMSITIQKEDKKITVRSEGLTSKDALDIIHELTTSHSDIKVKIQPSKKDENLLKEIILAGTKKQEQKLKPHVVIDEPSLEDTRQKYMEKVSIDEKANRIAASLAHAVKMDRDPKEEEILPERNNFGPLPNTKKTPEGVLLLKTYMKCPYCGNEHKSRYSRYRNDWVKCFECNQKLALAPVTPDITEWEGEIIPTIGPDGYYLMAIELYEELKDFNQYIVTK